MDLSLTLSLRIKLSFIIENSDGGKKAHLVKVKFLDELSKDLSDLH